MLWPALLYASIVSIGRFDRHLAIGVALALGLLHVAALTIIIVKTVRAYPKPGI